MKIQLLLTLLLLALIGAPARGDEEDLLRSRFLSEYPEAIKAWRAKFHNAVGAVRVTSEDGDGKGIPRSVVLHSFKCKLPYAAVMITSATKDGRQGQGVHGYNGKYSFDLKRSDAAQEYAVVAMKAAEGSGEMPKSSYLWTLLWAPYSSRVPNEHIVSSPRFVLGKVSPLARNGKRLAKVEFDNKALDDPENAKKPGFYGGFKGYFVFSPEEKWVLYEYECREKAGRLSAVQGNHGVRGKRRWLPNSQTRGSAVA